MAKHFVTTMKFYSLRAALAYTVLLIYNHTYCTATVLCVLDIVYTVLMVIVSHVFIQFHNDRILLR